MSASAFVTLDVLAGAYRGKSVSDRTLLTHAARREGGDALCGLPGDHLSDEELDGPPSCPTCARRVMRASARRAPLERYAHETRARGTGRYLGSPPCDACGKPVGTAWYTDSDVCGGSDGPGFYLCERKRCAAKLTGLSVDARRAIYVATRAAHR